MKNICYSNHTLKCKKNVNFFLCLPSHVLSFQSYLTFRTGKPGVLQSMGSQSQTRLSD